MNWSRPMPREYWQQKWEDAKEAHQFATRMMEETDGVRRWNWETERKRLAQICNEIKRAYL